MNAPPLIDGLLGADRKQYILSLLSKFKHSGLTRAAFAEREGVSINTLDAWRRRFKSTPHRNSSDSDITFVEAKAQIASNLTVEIVLSGGRALRVPDSISEGELASNRFDSGVLMLSIPPSVRIFLARGKTDLRKNFDGLCGAARVQMEQDPLSGHLFAFCNGSRNRLKILFWDGTGFCIYHKKLAKGTFSWPGHDTHPSAELRSSELLLILSGLDLTATRERPWHRRRYPEVTV